MHGHGRSIRLLAAALWLTACSHAPTVDGGDLAPVDTLAAYWPGATWRSAEPAAVGMDGAAMQAVASRLRAGAIPGLHAFIVVRHGWVVAESYFAGTRGEDLHTLQSVSKSVTSLLVGIAQDRGELASIDAPLLGFFPEYPDVAAAADARKRAVRLRDVLAMRSGISFWEEPYAGSPLEQLNGCRCDWLRLVLDRPMAAAPDAAWSYNSGAVITLGGVLYAATGMPADAYARQVLFAPLGITASSWSKGLPNGLPHMGGGLALRPIDVARIGYLVLRRGRWNDRQVVSAAWLDRSTARVTTTTERYFPRATDYGLLWWLFPRNGGTGAAGGDDYVVAASGTGGQWLFVDRAKDLVVVFNGALDSRNWPAVQLLFESILPAAR